MTPLQKLYELVDMMECGDLYNDDCEHTDPANPPDDKFCPICFITNLAENCSDNEFQFNEETTQTQRDKIEELWDEHANS